MRVAYTEEMLKLSRMIQPYRTLENMKPGFKPGTPSAIIEANERLMKLFDEKLKIAEEWAYGE